MECAAYGTPKDRKKMLKALKGFVAQTLLHKDAYMVILRLADVMDDTVSGHDHNHNARGFWWTLGVVGNRGRMRMLKIRRLPV
jgi:hypothetical protein